MSVSTVYLIPEFWSRSTLSSAYMSSVRLNLDKKNKAIRTKSQMPAYITTSVVDPELFIPDQDPALNFPSSGSMRIRVQPIFLKYIWKL